MVPPMVTLNDGNTMPQIGLGVWKASDGAEVEYAVRTALDAGYRLIDTAAVYQNEAGVGRAIRSSATPRSDIFVTTKLWNNDQGAGRARPALQKSLKKLMLDYIDLYLIHWPMPARNLYVQSWQELEKMRDEGLIRSIGVCNFQVEHLEELKNRSHTVPAVNQIELHPNFQQKELRRYAAKNDIKIEAWSPLGGSKGSLLSDERLGGIAVNRRKSPAQVVLRWHIQNGLIVIPKSTNLKRIQENYDVFDFELTNQEMAVIAGLHTGTRTGPDPTTMNIHASPSIVDLAVRVRERFR